MTLAYLGTSAAKKLVVDEPESDELVEHLASGPRLIASWLLHTEMHCAARRHPDAIDLSTVDHILTTVNLVDRTRGDMLAAGTHAPLRSNDALHLAVAIRLGTDEIVTYDAEVSAAAKAAGLEVRSPGSTR